ncbi:hypothetical protein HAX54_048447 [Datura stramonium]|uniref:HD/PDEase domain-containing protein n=1 Tax=Datura stramonium TaxID=4076 RepID=A0ABS8RHX7_DATST|nr:hypothetical protein [Datura stramonium]
MAKKEIITKAEELVEKAMSGNDASHDVSHAFRVRDLTLSLAHEEGLSSSSDSMLIVELAALLHDIGDYKYIRLDSTDFMIRRISLLPTFSWDPSEARIVEEFLQGQGIEEGMKKKILDIIKGMGFKEEVGGLTNRNYSIEYGVVQDADRLDAIGAIGIARCFTFGGSRHRILHDPRVQPRSELSKENYMNKEEQTTVNHFHEKLLKLKDLMKTKAGKKRAEKRHKFMEDFLEEFYEEWDGRA